MPQIYTAASPVVRSAVSTRNRAQAPEPFSEIQRRRHEAFTRDAVPMNLPYPKVEAVGPTGRPTLPTRELLLSTEAHHLSRKQVVDLMEENLTLREALRQMQESLAPQAFLPGAWGLTGKERDLLLALRKASPNVLHKERLLITLYGVLDDDVPDQKILDVFVCKIRQKLARAEAGVAIQTIWGRGWRIDSENLTRLNAHIDAASEPDWTPGTPLFLAAE